MELIVPDGLWEIAKPLIPPSMRVRPQGGGTQDTPDATLLAAIIYVPLSDELTRLGQIPPIIAKVDSRVADKQGCE